MRRLRSSSLGLLCLLGLATSLVTGCSHDADSSGRSGDEAAPEAEDVEVTPNELAFEDPGPGPLSTIRLAMERPPGALPHEISPGVQEAVIVADLLYDGLTEAAGADGRLAGGLAVDWSANDELTEWTFSIDTDRIEPAVVVAHFEELLAERAADTGSGMLLAHVGGVELTSGSEVRFHLNEPVAAFPWLVSGVAMSVPGVDGEPTGRWSIVSDTAGAMVLTPTSGSGPVPDLQLVWEESPQDAYNTLTLGLADAAVAPASALADAERRFGAVPPDRAISRFYGVNLESSALADERLRRAVIHALDRGDLVSDGGMSPALAIDGVVAPSLAGYRPARCGSPCDLDRAEARVLVRAVRDEQGGAAVSLSVAYSGDEQAGLATAIGGALESVGLEPTVAAYDEHELAGVIAAGDADLFAFGWVAGSGSLDAVVPALFRTDSPANAWRVRSPEIDDLIARAAATVDDRRRWELLNDAHDVALQSGAVLPLAVARSHLVVAPQVVGLGVRADGSLAFEHSQ